VNIFLALKDLDIKNDFEYNILLSLPMRFFLGASPRRVFFTPEFQGKFTYSGNRSGK
jgi:hypothetical protein